MTESNTVPTDGPCCATGARATAPDTRDPNWRDIENEIHNAVVMVRGRITGPIAERVAIALEVTQRWVHDAGILDNVLRGPDSKAAVADTMVQQLVRDIVTETASGWAPSYLEDHGMAHQIAAGVDAELTAELRKETTTGDESE